MALSDGSRGTGIGLPSVKMTSGRVVDDMTTADATGPGAQSILGGEGKSYGVALGLFGGAGHPLEFLGGGDRDDP